MSSELRVLNRLWQRRVHAPVGKLVDSAGASASVIFGVVLLGVYVGYLPQYE